WLPACRLIKNETFGSWGIRIARAIGARTQLRATGGADSNNLDAAKHPEAVSRADSARSEVCRHRAEQTRRGGGLPAGAIAGTNLFGIGRSAHRRGVGAGELCERTLL